MGYGEVVTHMTLTHTFVGSNPTTPAFIRKKVSIMATKICTKCGKELPEEFFYWRNKAKGQRRATCKYCHGSYVKVKYQENKDYLNQIKMKNKCAKCGENRFWCLDFHHINPDVKEENLSRMTSHQRKKEDIDKELEKCVILCANCHRDFHYLQTETGLQLNEYLAE